MKTTSILLCAAALIAGTGGLFAFRPAADGAETMRRDGTSMGAANPVVIELFTSQGCSSCPPADALAARLAQDPALIVLSRPVTYWDRLGWKDTLGREENSALQRGYARRGNAGAGVYTPQMIVDGRHGAVGSDERKLRALVRDAASVPKPQISISRDGAGTLRAALSGQITPSAQLMLVSVSSHEAVRIGRGENGGRTVSYTNVVLNEIPMAQSPRSGGVYRIPAGRLKTLGADRYALILRQPDAGRVLAGKIIP